MADQTGSEIKTVAVDMQKAAAMWVAPKFQAFEVEEEIWAGLQRFLAVYKRR